MCRLSEDDLCRFMVFRNTFGLSSSLLTDVTVALMIQLPVNHHGGIEGLEMKANSAICHFLPRGQLSTHRKLLIKYSCTRVCAKMQLSFGRDFHVVQNVME